MSNLPTDAPSATLRTTDAAHHVTLLGTFARVGAGMAIAIFIVLAIYVASSVPNTWFPAATPKLFTAKDVTLTKGTGHIVDDELLVTAADANGISLISLVPDLNAREYPAIAWIVADTSDRAAVRMLWRNDIAPEILNVVGVPVEGGRTLPVIVTSQTGWTGHITGLALAIQGPVLQPVRIRGVIAKPMGALEIAADRAREWFAFEGWVGTSINTVNGGADSQGLPLPILLGIAVVLTSVAGALIERTRPGTFGVAAPVILAIAFLLAWLVLDARWTFNLVRQEWYTAQKYAGKSARDKLLANDDAQLFAFVERALQVLPSHPVRIYVAGDADYFRGRAAYHLYPHSVFFDPRSKNLQWAVNVRPGDWVLIYHQPEIQYDITKQLLRWPSGRTTSAELKLIGPEAVLFQVH